MKSSLGIRIGPYLDITDRILNQLSSCIKYGYLTCVCWLYYHWLNRIACCSTKIGLIKYICWISLPAGGQIDFFLNTFRKWTLFITQSKYIHPEEVYLIKVLIQQNTDINITAQESAVTETWPLDFEWELPEGQRRILSFDSFYWCIIYLWVVFKSTEYNFPLQLFNL